MLRIAALLAIVFNLAACDAISTLTDGWGYAKAVESDLETTIGMKPAVGFNWRNGFLETVTVTFPRMYEDKPLRVLAETVRRSVASKFRQTPRDIVLGFSLGRSSPGTTAQLDETN